MISLIAVSKTRLRPGPGLQMPNILVWSVALARTIQDICKAELAQSVVPVSEKQNERSASRQGLVVSESFGVFKTSAIVTGHTTPALADIGCASVRVAVDDAHVSLREGGYLVALGRPGHKLLPAIAGVPGNRGPDRYMQSRIGLAECVVLGRPLCDGHGGNRDKVTFLHDQVLQKMFPEGEVIEMAVLGRVTDFFLGLNAGTWLKVRMQQISEASMARVEAMEPPGAADAHGLPAKGVSISEAEGNSIAELLDGTGLAVDDLVEAPPDDSQWLFDHWGAGGNTGVSGQKTYEAYDPQKIY